MARRRCRCCNGGASVFFGGEGEAGSGEKEVPRLAERGVYEDSPALFIVPDFVMPPQVGVAARPVGRGFYEASRALLLTLDLVMSPTGRGRVTTAPAPRVPGAAPLGTPCRPAPHSYAGQLPCGASRLRVIWRWERDVPLSPAAMTPLSAPFQPPRCDACTAVESTVLFVEAKPPWSAAMQGADALRPPVAGGMTKSSVVNSA